VSDTNLSTLEDHFQQYVGSSLAILCARYQYRGKVSSVGKGFIVLSDACCVEQSGACNLPKPVREDPIVGSLTISLAAIEIAHQPNWVDAEIIPTREG
jgi:hypothetical protein